MSNVTVAAEQNLFDLGLEQSGSVEGAFALAANNGLSMNEPMREGAIINVGVQAENFVVLDWWRREKAGERLATGEQGLEDSGLAFSEDFDNGFA